MKKIFSYEIFAVSGFVCGFIFFTLLSYPLNSYIMSFDPETLIAILSFRFIVIFVLAVLQGVVVTHYYYLYKKRNIRFTRLQNLVKYCVYGVLVILATKIMFLPANVELYLTNKLGF